MSGGRVWNPQLSKFMVLKIHTKNVIELEGGGWSGRYVKQSSLTFWDGKQRIALLRFGSNVLGL